MKEYPCSFLKQLTWLAIQDLTNKITALFQEDITEIHRLEDNLVQLSTIIF